MIPLEIWELVLKQIERSSAHPTHFLRLKRVCKDWNAIVTRLSKQSDKWYLECLNVIPKPVWGVILEHHFDPDLDCRNFDEAKKNPLWFMSLYKSWIQLQRLNRTNIVKKTLESSWKAKPDTVINCIAASGSVIVTGDSEGRISFYDITSTKTYPQFKITFGRVPIKDIQLWRKGISVIAVISYIYDRVVYWDIRSERRIAGHDNDGTSFRSASFEYLFQLIDNPGYVPTMLIERRTELVAPDCWVEALPIGHRFLAVSSEGNEVMVWMESDLHIKLNEIRKESYAICPFMVRRPNVDADCQLVYSAFKPRILAFHGGYHFGFSIAGRQWKIYLSLTMFRSAVTAILFHARILIFGFESGTIQIFKVENPDDLENFNFHMALATEVYLNMPSITTMKITECNSEQYLIALADRNKIRIVKFESEKESRVSPLLVDPRTKRSSFREVYSQFPPEGIAPIPRSAWDDNSRSPQFRLEHDIEMLERQRKRKIERGLL